MASNPLFPSPPFSRFFVSLPFEKMTCTPNRTGRSGQREGCGEVARAGLGLSPCSGQLAVLASSKRLAQALGIEGRPEAPVNGRIGSPPRAAAWHCLPRDRRALAGYERALAGGR